MQILLGMKTPGFFHALGSGKRLAAGFLMAQTCGHILSFLRRGDVGSCVGNLGVIASATGTSPWAGAVHISGMCFTGMRHQCVAL